MGDKKNMRPWYNLTANNCKLLVQQCWKEGSQQIDPDICTALVGLPLEYSILFWDPCFKGDLENNRQVWPRAATTVQALERRCSVREVEGAGLVLPSEEEPKG